MAKQSSTFKEHMERRMHTFKERQMHSRKQRTGPVVTSREQAIAISLSEARKKGLKGAPRARADLHSPVRIMKREGSIGDAY